MQSILTLILIVVSVLLLFSILLQHRASGLSATFGGTGATYIQRRGAERVIYRAAIVLSIIFFLIPVIEWYVV